jgi:adenylosuccinate synthase
MPACGLKGLNLTGFTIRSPKDCHKKMRMPKKNRNLVRFFNYRYRMKADVILGLQWGDEGKGKVVDVLTPRYDVVARFQGGPNAGHTLEFNGEKYILRSIPSGIFQGNKMNIIGNGVVLDPAVFRSEAEALARSGHELTDRIAISRKAHLILPTHRLLDAAYEEAKGKDKVGTTGKGIGPAYTDKASRNGLRVGDILHDFEAKYAKAKARHEELLRQLNFSYDLAEAEREWFEGIEFLKKFCLIDSEQMINQTLSDGKSVLCEGAQGTMLDVDFGSYPFVTSSNTICAGACTGLGIAPNRIGEVYGIFKAYCTRVGAGPFPTELNDESGEAMCSIGREYGSVTGRKRRCGWLDLVALKYSVMINGVTALIMMKSDVLNDFDTVKVATAYKIGSEFVDHFPYELDDSVKPVYTEFKGWKQDIDAVRRYEDFPREVKDYVEFIEKETGVPVKIISVGPDREATVVRD